MPYALTFNICEIYEKRFDTVSNALTSYRQIQANIGWGLQLFPVRLRGQANSTLVDLYPGITVQVATLELESMWEWELGDDLDMRQVLKKQYRTMV